MEGSVNRVSFGGMSSSGTYHNERQGAVSSGRAEIRQFLRGIAGDRSSSRTRNPGGGHFLDRLEVVRNDLSTTDIELVRVRRPERETAMEFFTRLGGGIKNLAEHKMLRGAAGQLNSMLAATRSFFW